MVRLTSMRNVLLAALAVLLSASAQAQTWTPLQKSITSTTCATQDSNGCVWYLIAGGGSVGIQVEGTWAGTITFEASVDGSTFRALNMIATNGTSQVTTTTSNGTFTTAVGALRWARARFSSYTSGTAVVTINAAGGGQPIPPASISGSFSGNSAASATGAAVPADAGYTGLNVGGNLVGATGMSLGSQVALPTAIVDGSGNQITSFGGGTQYANGSAQATPTGTVMLGWDGANVRAAATDSSGNVQVEFPSAQAVTVSSSALPTGAATAAKQPALGTAGSASTDVITIQGIASGTVVPVSDGGESLTVDGTVAATQSGNWSARMQDGSGNALTSATRGSERAISVQVVDASGNQVTNFSGSGSNAAASATGSAVPSSADYQGVNIGGTLTGVTGVSVGSARAPTVAIVDGSGNQVTSFGGSGGTASNFTSAFPSSGTAAGFSDGTNMQGARVYDTDSGGGTQYTAGVSLRKAASGGSVEAGTSSDPLRVDPTGTTTQPVSASSLPLPSGASTAAKQPALGTAGTASSDVITIQGIASMTPIIATGATTPADNFSNPSTAQTVWSLSGCWDGSNWDRCPTSDGGAGATTSNTTRVVVSADTQACADISQVSAVPISTATSGNVQLVAISGSTVVYVCGFDATSVADVSVQFVSGTGTACATGETDRTGVYNLSAASGAGIRGIARPNGGAPQFKGAAGEAMCIELSAAVQVDGLLTYVQR